MLAGWVDHDYRWIEGRVQFEGAGAAYGVDGDVLLIDPASTFGFSGGPVLDASGRVVGVLHAVDQVTDLSLAVPVSAVREWLEMDVQQAPATRCME